MRQGGPNGRRPRGRHHGGHDRHSHGGGQGGGNRSSDPMSSNRPRSAAALRHQTFDSHCLDVRVRGNAWQVCEKYQSLARDATGAGDRVAAENYLQHAEHYFRIIEAINEATALEQRQRGGAPSPFGDQPNVPANYYSPEGNLAAPSPENAGAGQVSQQGAQPQGGQAEVIQQRPQQQQSPFFSNDETEESPVGQEPVAARR